MNIVEIKKENIIEIKAIWEELRSIHQSDSTYFKEFYKSYTFEERVGVLLNSDKDVKIFGIHHENNLAGFCLSSISGSVGEIESLCVSDRYRGLGYGKRLVNFSLDWFTRKQTQKIQVTVAEGHESVFDFYKMFGFYPRLTTLVMREDKESYRVTTAEFRDLPEILAIQKLAFYDVAKFYNNYKLGPLQVTLEEMESRFKFYTYYKIVIDGQIVASLRVKISGNVCKIENVVVHPLYQNRGLGKQLLNFVEDHYPDITLFALFTGKDTPKNVEFYEKLGYCIVSEKQATESEPVLVTMNKMR